MTQWLSRFTFGEGPEVWLPRLPVGLWQHSVPTVGVRRKTATGLPGVTFGQRQHQLVVPVRFYEDEAPVVRRLIEWGQSKATFLWWPDRSVIGSEELTVILAAPRVADLVTFEPDGQYPRVSVVNLTFRQLVAGGES